MYKQSVKTTTPFSDYDKTNTLVGGLAGAGIGGLVSLLRGRKKKRSLLSSLMPILAGAGLGAAGGAGYTAYQDSKANRQPNYDASKLLGRTAEDDLLTSILTDKELTGDALSAAWGDAQREADTPYFDAHNYLLNNYNRLKENPTTNFLE